MNRKKLQKLNRHYKKMNQVVNIQQIGKNKSKIHLCILDSF